MNSVAGFQILEDRISPCILDSTLAQMDFLKTYASGYGLCHELSPKVTNRRVRDIDDLLLVIDHIAKVILDII